MNATYTSCVSTSLSWRGCTTPYAEESLGRRTKKKGQLIPLVIDDLLLIVQYCVWGANVSMNVLAELEGGGKEGVLQG